MSYPALLAVRVPALPANVANLVAATVCWPGTALVSRRELAGTRGWLIKGLLAAAVGAGVGAALLLATPPGVFTRVVPFLVATGSVALLAQPWLTTRVRRPGGTVLGVAVLSVYSGYFGAGSGIMLLALLLLSVDDRMPQACGLFVGSLVGPVVVRRVPSSWVRWVVGGLGLVLAVLLWFGS